MPERKNIVAHTGADCQFPSFVSVHDHGEHVVVTMRGKQVRNDAKGRNDPGPMAEITMSHEAWSKVIADAAAYKRSA